MRENLKKARKDAGMTQQQMADKLGLNLRHYQKIEYCGDAGCAGIRDVARRLDLWAEKEKIKNPLHSPSYGL